MCTVVTSNVHMYMHLIMYAQIILALSLSLDPVKAALVSRQLPRIPVTSPTSPPADILLPSLNPNFLEETTSAGGGNLLNLSDTSPAQPQTSNGTSKASDAGRDFFSQLDWQESKENAKSAGYVPFEDRIPEDFESASGSSSGSSSDGESSDEFNMFHAPVRPDSKQGSIADEGGLLIGNFDDNTTAGTDLESNTPQIKLIQFGAELSESQQTPPTSSPTSYVDPFQQQQPSSSSSKPTSDPFGVVFDPFSGLSSTEANPPSNADSAFGDLLGFGIGDSVQTPMPQSGTTSNTASEVPSNPPTQSSGTEDFFDPFGSLSGNQGTPTLMPTSTVPPSNFSRNGHRYSEPFTNPSMMPSSVLTPEVTQNQGRKLSSPEPSWGSKRPPSATSNKLSASFSASVSHSHPNLASFGATRLSSSSSSAQKHSGWGSGMGITGMGGSVSHNTSPRRSPSPVPQSSSTGNIAQQAQTTQFDPFQQFNLSEISEGMNGMKVSGAKPPPATSHHSKPPTGNSYQPYYMQKQGRNGAQQQSTSQPSRQANTGVGPKPKSASTFQARPQSPNYNPSLFSTVGNKTGMCIQLTVTLSLLLSIFNILQVFLLSQKKMLLGICWAPTLAPRKMWAQRLV